MKNVIEKALKGLSPQSIEALCRRELFIGLDRDGTLVPIHAHPTEAIVPKHVQSLVLKCASLPGVYLCIVSARSITQLRNDFGTKGITLAGNYGLEIDLAGGEKFVHPVAEKARRLLLSTKKELTARLAEKIPVLIEDHGLSLCVHWHLVPALDQQFVHKVVASLQDKFSELHFRLLPTSYEVMPVDNWNKADALNVISAHLPELRNRFSIFVGDSQGDEPAFSWVNQLQGLSIRVGPALDSCAKLRLSTPWQVVDFLTQLQALRLGLE